MTVSVLLPTFRRPEGLRTALASLLAQTRKPDEIIVIDNAPEGGADPIVSNAAAVAGFPVRYVHEPRPGVAHARNAGLAAARGRHIAFLDDDEIADPLWLDSLMQTAERLGANIVFGPLRAETPGADGVRKAWADRLYSRPGGAEDRTLNAPYGCGNSLIDRAAFTLPETPFDPELNETGGEDDAFFALLEEQGAKFAWSARAWGRECVEPARTAWPYLASRAFAFGQGPCQNAARKGVKGWPVIAGWMLIGAAQLAVFGVLTGLIWPIDARRAAICLDKAVQGAGKLAWFEGLEPRFYGAASQAKG